MSTSYNFKRLKYKLSRGADSPLSKGHSDLLASKRRLEQQHLAVLRKLRFLCLISDEAKDYAVQFDNAYRNSWTQQEWLAWVKKQMTRAGR